MESNANGTTFTVSLPVTNEEMIINREEEKEDLHGNGTILVVDDVRGQLDISSRLPRSLGYDVVTADSWKVLLSII